MAYERFEARKRTALDGLLWWCVWDKARHNWSTFLVHGKYRRKKDAEYAISTANKVLIGEAK